MEDGSMRFVHLTTLLPADGVYFINVELEPGEDYKEKVLRNGQGGEVNPHPADQAPGKDRGTKKEDAGKVKPKKKTAGSLPGNPKGKGKAAHPKERGHTAPGSHADGKTSGAELDR